MPEPKTMSPEEIALRQSLEIMQNAIKDLCLRRDQLAAQLPKAPKQVTGKYFMGMEIKESSWRPKNRREAK